MRPTAGATAPTDALLTIPNVLTVFRLALIAPFLWVAIGPDRMDLALSVAMLGLVTDIIDGPIARRYGQVSKLGVALDPLSDRLGLAAGGAVMIVHDLAPAWAVAAILGRDALLLLAAAVLKGRRADIPPVSRLGKNASFAVSVAITLFIASGIPDVARPNGAVRAAAWAVYAVGTPLYYAAAAGYARAALKRAPVD